MAVIHLYRQVVRNVARAIRPECECRDSHRHRHDFCYSLPENQTIHGRRFDCRHIPTMQRLGLLDPSDVIDLNTQPLPVPVFVTAFSENHAKEGKRQLRMIRFLWPDQKVVFYDLGLEPGTLQFFKNACNVEVRQFPFDKYPPSMRRVYEYRWKPIVIAETLREFGSIFYADSSITFKKTDLGHVYDLVKCRRNTTEAHRPALLSIAQRDQREKTTAHESGWDQSQWRENVRECRKSTYMFHGFTGHGIFPATHPDVYTYFPTNMDEIRKEKAKMYEAGFVFAVRTSETIEKILKWYVLCALEDGCMAPLGASTGCAFLSNQRYNEYANCHRYDQSVVNLLAANAFHYDRHYYVSEIVDFFNVVRWAMDDVTAEEVQCRVAG